MLPYLHLLLSSNYLDMIELILTLNINGATSNTRDYKFTLVDFNRFISLLMATKSHFILNAATLKK